MSELEEKTVDEVAQRRLWKSLDDISGRLSNIESKLTDIVRLDEKVNSQREALLAQSDRINVYGSRVRSLEIELSTIKGREGNRAKIFGWIAGLAAGILMLVLSTFIKMD